MTVPGALEVIAELARNNLDVIAGAGTILDLETARRCLDAGAKSLTSPGLDLEVVEFAVMHEIAVFPGALTPTEVITAWKTGPDFVKVFPCFTCFRPCMSGWLANMTYFRPRMKVRWSKNRSRFSPNRSSNPSTGRPNLSPKEE